MKRKGFTLIELLAVIVILAIIALIATPIILSVIEKAKKGAAEVSATSYVGAIENYVMTSELKGTSIVDGEYEIDELEVKIKGEPPTSGTYLIEKGIVKTGTFCINNYNIEYSNSKSKATGKCGEESKKTGELKLSANSITMIYPIFRTVDIETNTSGGSLSCSSSDEEIATCSITDNTININPGTKDGNATITIISSETEKYKETKAALLVITQKGTLSYTANGYEGTYDEKNHSITVTSSDATITYSTDGENYSSENPSYTDAGTYTVYYKISKDGYNTITGNSTVKINKAEGSISLSSESGTIVSGNTTSITATSTGTISCLSSDTSIATCSVSDKTITINGVSAGTTTITVTSTATTNYNTISKTYSVTVKNKTWSDVAIGDYISMTPTSTSYTTDTSKTGYSSSQILNPSELNLWGVIKINDDGTIEMVSEYVSSVSIYFQGQTGYQNYVGYLNEIASQYENSKYTTASRIMGYNGQTEYITDTSKLTSTTIPWTGSTGRSSTVESLGGGDTLYTTDTNLVKTALGTLVANKVGTTTATAYWLGSRYYVYYSSFDWGFNVRLVNSIGAFNTSKGLLLYKSGFTTYSPSNAVRPILTLKSGIQATGSGTSSDPYVLN